MSNHVDFQIVCATCGCLSIRIEEPLKSSGKATVFCGDCGSSRGTMGALRDLAIQLHPNIVFPTQSSALPEEQHLADERQVSKISTQYAELQRLRQQVKIAEWLASESRRPPATKPIRKESARRLAFRPSPSALEVVHLDNERDQKRPS